MLRLGLSAANLNPPILPFAQGADLAFDFAAGLAAHKGVLQPISTLLHTERAHVGVATHQNGHVERFDANTARLTPEGLHIAGSTQRLHGEAPQNGVASGSGSSSVALLNEGYFSPRRFVSGGASWHKWALSAGPLTQAVACYVRVRYRAGTSQRCFIAMDVHASPNTRYASLAGPVGALSMHSNSGGVFDEIVQKDFGDGTYELTARLTPAMDATDSTFGVGAYSDVAGDSIDILGMQVTDQYSDWIFGGTGPITQPGDNTHIDLNGLPLDGGFVVQMDASLPTVSNASAYPRLYEASSGADHDRLTLHLNTQDGAIRLDHRHAGTSYGSYPLLSPVTQVGQFHAATGHSANFVGGGLAWGTDAPTMVTNTTGPIGYTPPVRFGLGSVDGVAQDFAAMTVRTLRLYARAPTPALLGALLS